MAIEFVVEDGTGLDDATSYLALDEFRQMWRNVGRDESTLSDDDVKTLLNRSTRVIDAIGANRWPGWRVSEDQALDWPRTGAEYRDGRVIVSDAVPKEIETATSEAAYAIHTAVDLEPVIEGAGAVQSETVNVGRTAVMESKTYFAGTERKRPEVTAINDALSRIIRLGRYGGMPVVRI